MQGGFAWKVSEDKINRVRGHFGADHFGPDFDVAANKEIGDFER